MLKHLLRNATNVRRREKFEKVPSEVQSIIIKTEVIQQIGIDTCGLLEIYSFKHLVVCIDYSSKWSEVRPIKDKSASTNAQFLYGIIFRHGCMKIQMHDQVREFVNEIRKVLHNMIGTEQRIISSYHSQSNELCGPQKRIIKDSLVKILDGNPFDWPKYAKEYYLHIGLANIFQQNFHHSS